MMLKSKVGYSNAVDAYEAGIETAKMATIATIKTKLIFLIFILYFNLIILTFAKTITLQR